jgi:hypothetical protein
MLPETELRVKALRGDASTIRMKLEHAKSLFGDNKDEYLRTTVQTAFHWLNDVETYFIRVLTDERVPPRTLAEETSIVSGAVLHLHKVVLPLINTIHEWGKEYGPHFKSIG